jgi:hypothetical protein
MQKTIDNMELENGYEELERTIVNSATERGILFEDTAKIKKHIKDDGLIGFEFIEMFRGRLEDKIRNPKNNI